MNLLCMCYVGVGTRASICSF